MDPNQFLEALRVRWLALVALTVAGLLGGVAYASAQPVLYKATSSVYVASQGGSTTQEQLQGSTFAQNIVQSYVELATEPVVLDPVIKRLGLRDSTEQLAKRVAADLDVNTVIIRVTATDQSPRRAADIANATTASLSAAARTLSATATGKKPGIVMHRVAEAKPPTQPSSPNVPLLLVAGLGLGFLVGLAYAVGRQLLDTRIGSDEQLRSVPGLQATPFLGALSHRRIRNRAVNVFAAEPHSMSAEEYRRVATNLEFAGIDRRITSITVTSALPGDGKSTIALNLAFAAAERGQRVLLVDGDLRRPSVAGYLGIDGSVGLTNVLLHTASLEQAVQRIGEVDVLPSGLLPPNVTQLVTSQTMERELGALLERYDFVVVDAPPVLPVIDALTFARLTDGAVVVARQRVTRRKQFSVAVESLRQVDVRVLGVLLNDVTRSERAYGTYGYEPKAATRNSVSARRKGDGAPEPGPSPVYADR